MPRGKDISSGWRSTWIWKKAKNIHQLLKSSFCNSWETSCFCWRYLFSVVPPAGVEALFEFPPQLNHPGVSGASISVTRLHKPSVSYLCGIFMVKSCNKIVLTALIIHISVLKLMVSFGNKEQPPCLLSFRIFCTNLFLKQINYIFFSGESVRNVYKHQSRNCLYIPCIYLSFLSLPSVCQFSLFSEHLTLTLFMQMRRCWNAAWTSRCMKIAADISCLPDRWKDFVSRREDNLTW